MSVTCPKCGYIRQPTDHAPDWQCPSCGVAYIKVQNRPAAAPAAPRPAPAATPVTKGGGSGVSKVIGGLLGMVVVVVIADRLMHRTAPPQPAVVAAAAPAAPAAAPAAAEAPAGLADAAVQELCTKYQGQRAFTAGGQDAALDCERIKELAAQAKTVGLIPNFREVLASAGTLDGLESAGRAGQLPGGMSCTNFTRNVAGATQQLSCAIDLGQPVPVIFEGDQSGALQDLTASLDYNAIYRGAYDLEVQAHKMDAYYQPWIDLQGDLLLAGLRQSAGPGDQVNVNGTRFDILVKKP